MQATPKGLHNLFEQLAWRTSPAAVLAYNNLYYLRDTESVLLCHGGLKKQDIGINLRGSVTRNASFYVTEIKYESILLSPVIAAFVAHLHSLNGRTLVPNGY